MKEGRGAVKKKSARLGGPPQCGGTVGPAISPLLGRGRARRRNPRHRINSHAERYGGDGRAAKLINTAMTASEGVVVNEELALA